MRFKITLYTDTVPVIIPVNYSYPLSAAIYKILQKADEEYADFLHEKGYGKGFKLFTFSQINCPFKIKRDRMWILANEISFEVAFHLPAAIENFVKGLFQTREIIIADRVSKGVFTVSSVESLPDAFKGYKEGEILRINCRPLSPVVAGMPNERGNYDFLDPGDEMFSNVVVHNWREKIKTCFGDAVAEGALLLAETELFENAPKSRLITVKAGTKEQTRIRGWMNFGLTVTAEKRFLELLMNSGAGVHNSLGCGMVGR